MVRCSWGEGLAGPRRAGQATLYPLWSGKHKIGHSAARGAVGPAPPGLAAPLVHDGGGRGTRNQDGGVSRVHRTGFHPDPGVPLAARVRRSACPMTHPPAVSPAASSPATSVTPPPG